jgi:hypothetical protein
MDIQSTYQKIIQEIEEGNRGFIRLNRDDIDELNLLLGQGVYLEEILCIIEHSFSSDLKFEKNLLKTLGLPLSDHLLIFALNCGRKHIIEARFQRGQRLDFEFLEALKKLLHHPSPEVVEWTLRLIEGCGNQGVYFLREFDRIKPPPWKWFNSHQRAVREIIALLERRWSHVEKSKSGY